EDGGFCVGSRAASHDIGRPGAKRMPHWSGLSGADRGPSARSAGIPPSLRTAGHAMTTALLRLGISRCLLGDEVRFDGGHKRDEFLTDIFGRYVEWVPVCPEVEAGLGTPREAMRLVGDPQHPRLITIKSAKDHTEALEGMTVDRLRSLKDLDLSGYVFKKDSPSCGVQRVRIFNRHGMPSRNGTGLFARAFMERFPMVPVEEEGRL